MRDRRRPGRRRRRSDRSIREESSQRWKRDLRAQISTRVDGAACHAGRSRHGLHRSRTSPSAATPRSAPTFSCAGRTAIGEGCRLDGSAFISRVHRSATRAHLRFGVVIDESAGRRRAARSDRFANLRPKTRLAEGVHIGDFVETKNAVLGRGVKANHLAYLGDAEIGSGRTASGAGTITCSYDGLRQAPHRDRRPRQVGSDSTLVAPVHDRRRRLPSQPRRRSGRDVPAGALAFNPREQQQRRRLGRPPSAPARPASPYRPTAAKPRPRKPVPR